MAEKQELIGNDNLFTEVVHEIIVESRDWTVQNKGRGVMIKGIGDCTTIMLLSEVLGMRGL